jgi:hypothetical protein
MSRNGVLDIGYSSSFDTGKKSNFPRVWTIVNEWSLFLLGDSITEDPYRRDTELRRLRHVV